MPYYLIKTGKGRNYVDPKHLITEALDRGFVIKSGPAGPSIGIHSAKDIEELREIENFYIHAGQVLFLTHDWTYSAR